MSSPLVKGLTTVILAASMVLALVPCARAETIVFQTFLKPEGTSPREVALAQIVKKFTETTGIQVKYQILPWVENDTQLMLSVQAGNPPDVSFVRDRNFAKHLQANSLLPLDDFIKKDLTDKDKKDFLLWDSIGTQNGKKYTFPTSLVVFTLMIRKDLLQKAGLNPPKTWDDFIKVAKALNSPTVSGFMFGGSQATPNQFDIMQMVIEGRGGKVLDANGKAVFDSQAGVDSFKFLKSLIYDSKVMPATAVTAKYDDVTDIFATGRAAMIIEGSHRYGQIAQKLKPENVLLAKIPGVTATKYSPAGVNSWTLGIPRNAKHAEAAWKFIKFFASAESNLQYSKVSGEVPIRKSVMDNEYYKSPEGAVVRWYVDYVSENSTLMVAPVAFQELVDIAAKATQEILSKADSNVGEILENAAKTYNALSK